MADPLPLLLFILVIFCIIASEIVLQGVKDKCKCLPWLNFVVDALDFSTIAVLGVGLFAVARQLSWKAVENGIVGDDHITPYAVVLLFLSLAYVSISVDESGLFEFAAIHVVRLSCGNGPRLMIFIFLLSGLVGILTSNDVVIFTFTPIIVAVANLANISAVPFAFAQFVAANICSVTLLTGNPANIIAGDAFGLTYIGYVKWTVLPMLFCASAALGLLLLIFRAEIPPSLFIAEVDEWSRLKSIPNAYASAALLLVTILLLMTSNLMGVPLYIITLSSAGVMLCKDLVLDYRHYRMASAHKESTPLLKQPQVNEHYDRENDSQRLSVQSEFPGSNAPIDSASSAPNAPAQTPQSNFLFPTVRNVALRLPWKVPPFLFSMFILVSSLQDHGWTDELARLFKIAEHSVVESALLMGAVSFVVAQFLNNLPTTVLFSKVVTSPDFIADEKVKFGALMGLILGSNLCAFFSLFGAMAGIVWSKLLKNRGVNVSYLRFLGVGLRIAPIVLLIGCLIMAFEVDLIR